MAVEMRAVGINWDFAPVLDVNCNDANPVIGVRSFGGDAGTVARYGLAALRGYADGGVLACGKHFPGHGDTRVDSHLDLPTVEYDRARLDAVELAPFRAAIDAGIPSLMTAHIRFPVLDDLPATLSEPVLTGLLRGELGFRGLVITDALNMLAIANTYGPAESAVRAIAAGADQCIALFDPGDLRAAHAAILAAVDSGRIPESRFREAVGRVLALKAGVPATGPGTPLSFPVDAHQEPGPAGGGGFRHRPATIAGSCRCVRRAPGGWVSSISLWSASPWWKRPRRRRCTCSRSCRRGCRACAA